MKKFVAIISAICFSSAVHAQTINNLGSATTPLAGTELVPMFQGANPAKQASTQSIANLAVTSIATSCQATGGTITTTGTISTIETVNAQSGSNYAILGTDCGKLVNLSNASNQVPTIAQAGTGSFTAGYYVDVVNTGAGTQTITPTTSTINGASTYVLSKGQGIRIVSDGTNYQVMPGIGLPPDGITTTGVSGTLYATGGAHPGYTATFWYKSLASAASSAGQALTSNNIYCEYWPVLNRATAETLGADVTTLFSGGHLAIALYSNQVTSGQGVGVPGALIDFVSPLSETSTAIVTGALQSNRQLGPGGSAGGREIWACVSQDNSTAAIQAVSSVNGSTWIGQSTTGSLWNGTNPGLTCSTCEGAPAWSAGAWTWPNNLNTSTWAILNNGAKVPDIGIQFLSQP